MHELMDLLRNNDHLQVDDPYYQPVTPVAMLALTEHQLQVAVIQECERRALTNPLYGLIFAIPNGGQRSKAQAGKLKAEGVKAGVPDLCLPLARHGYHGLFIELKVQGNRTSDLQALWIERLGDMGYLCHVLYRLDDVVRVLKWYIEEAEDEEN